MQPKGNNGTYTKTSLVFAILPATDSISRVLFSEDTKWSLPVIIKSEGNLCLSIHIVAIKRQCYLNFHMGIKFCDDLHPMFCPSYFSSHTSYLCLRLQVAHVLRYNIRKA